MKTNHDSETPAKGQQVLTASAFIHNIVDGKDKLFMPRRAETKKFLPDIYELPGGHIDYGEEMVEGLKREIFEEFGMKIEVKDPFFAFTYLNKVKGSHSIEVIYFASFTDPIESIELHPEDHSGYIWIDESEINKVTEVNKDIDDKEIDAIKKGFRILSGKQIKY